MSVAFVDTETLGLDPHRHAIWEIAIIVDDVEHCWQVTLSHAEMAAADPKALEISRFDQRRTRDCLSPTKSAARVQGLLDGRHIVGAVPSFDEQRLALLCDRMLRGGLPPTGRRPWHYHVIDIEAMAVGYLYGKGSEMASPEDWATPLPWKSHDLTMRLGVETPAEDEHTALGDARWAKRVYERIVNGGAL